MKPIRVVVDTNVFIDAIFNNDDSCQAILKHKHDGNIVFCMNEKMYKELCLIFGRHLEKVKLNRHISNLLPRFGNTLWEVEAIPHKTYTEYCIEDHEDDKFIDCCIDGKINYLISQDGGVVSVRDSLQEIKDKHNIDINILSPFQFNLEFLKRNINK